MTPKPPPPPGSYRAKLAELNQQDKARKPHLVRLAIMSCGALLLVVLLQIWDFGDRSNLHRIPDTLSKQFKEADWAGLEKMLTDDFVCRGALNMERAEVLSFIKAWAGRGLVFTTSSIKSGKLEEDARWLTFFAIFSRGDLDNADIIPLIDTWFVRLEVVAEDSKNFRIRKATVNDTLTSDGK